MVKLKEGTKGTAGRVNVTTNQYCEFVTKSVVAVMVVKLLVGCTVNRLLQISHPLARIAVGIRLNVTPCSSTPFPNTCPPRDNTEPVLFDGA